MAKIDNWAEQHKMNQKKPYSKNSKVNNNNYSSNQHNDDPYNNNQNQFNSNNRNINNSYGYSNSSTYNDTMMNNSMNFNYNNNTNAINHNNYPTNTNMNMSNMNMNNMNYPMNDYSFGNNPFDNSNFYPMNSNQHLNMNMNSNYMNMSNMNMNNMPMRFNNMNNMSNMNNMNNMNINRNMNSYNNSTNNNNHMNIINRNNSYESKPANSTMVNNNNNNISPITSPSLVSESNTTLVQGSENSKSLLNQYFTLIGTKPTDSYQKSTCTGQPPNQVFETKLNLSFENNSRPTLSLIGVGPNKKDSMTDCANQAIKILSDLKILTFVNGSPNFNLNPTTSSSSTSSTNSSQQRPLQAVVDIEPTISSGQIEESKKYIAQRNIICNSLNFDNCILLVHSNGGINGILGPSGISWKFDTAKRKVEVYCKSVGYAEDKVYRFTEPLFNGKKRFIVDVYLPIHGVVLQIAHAESDQRKLSENVVAVDVCEYLFARDLITGDSKSKSAITLESQTFLFNLEQLSIKGLESNIEKVTQEINQRNINYRPMVYSSDTDIARKEKIMGLYGRVTSLVQEKSHQELSDIGYECQNLEMIRKTNRDYIRISAKRKELPIYNQRQNIIDNIKNNQIIILAGETGCGKTTQVPQFILEDMTESGHAPYCNIIMTQPRRISVIGSAERIAYERLERVGDSVGYQIRFDSVMPSGVSKLLVCTPGILLKRMYSDTILENISHLFIDEAHERDIHTDFLLIIIKRLLAENRNLRVIIMSATMNTNSFSQYFNGCPIFNVSSNTHDVTPYYLEDIDKFLKSGDQSIYDETIVVNYQLIINLLQYMVSNSTADHSILIFLPGWEDISQLRVMMQNHPIFGNERDCMVLILHSSLSMHVQSKVFERPPKGVRKIILSTNIAETSITIDDIIYVIDSAKVKEKYHEAQRDVTQFQTCWASKSSLRQRKGRAGRVTSGYCYHLITKERYNSLDENSTPEMLRMPLHELCLQVKVLVNTSIKEFLQEAIEPPKSVSIDNAISLLYDLGALDKSQNLTPLGFQLSFIPVDPRLGKMIILSAFFRCLDPILTIAAFSNQKNPIQILVQNDENPTQQQNQHSLKSQHYPELLSDHLSYLKLYNYWHLAKSKGDEQQFCNDKCLSIPTLQQIFKVKKQLLHIIQEIGIIHDTIFKDGYVVNNHFNHNSENLELIRSIICSGYFPNVARQKRKKEFSTFSENTFLHPSSIIYNVLKESNSRPWLIFEEKLRTKITFIKSVTKISEISLIFFGGKLIQSTSTTPGLMCIEIHNTPIKLNVSTTLGDIIMRFRDEFEKSLYKFIENSYHNIDYSFSQEEYNFEQTLLAMLKEKVHY
ncbi:DEAD/DEAH box helicase [Tieghemostelium lacteum]|uniref:RNA helicase n=1 Tax=Tieghemostelium lacteum TaxID=361077 RepID=A0A152A3H0_TIELA|nr:DEAD/DEAH box helicase [Tieghemostelium lacteum]|eukprot:KYR00759.1 DEAD/DEAH box helicase [Tieghemostelium lacteum]